MTNEEHNSDHELQELLARLPAPAGPSAQLRSIVRDRVLDEYDRAAHSPPAESNWRRTIHLGGRIMSHPASRVVVGLAAVLVLTVWLAVPRRSIAFGDFLAPIVDAKSAKFKVTMTNDVQPQEFTATGYFLAPNRIRNEFAAPAQMVTTGDFDRGRMLTLMPDKKQAMIFDIVGKRADDKNQSNNFFGNLRKTLADYRAGDKKAQVEELGEKDLDGRRVFGFRLVATGLTQTLWGDVATGHVVRIESTANGPPKSEVVMLDFEFDIPLDESLFSVDPPADYQSFTVPIDAAPPSEEDFLTSLRRLSDALDGQLPSSLDTPGIAIAFAKLLKNKMPKGSDDMTKEMMAEGVAIGRGLQFAMMLPPDADAHYAGKGVKRDGPKTPIFWFKPIGAAQFRVIYSDLSAGDADAAPEVPGAIRMVDQFRKSDPKKEPAPKNDQPQSDR
jgi:outer membrane lipoprotein-sorting protein